MIASRMLHVLLLSIPRALCLSIPTEKRALILGFGNVGRAVAKEAAIDGRGFAWIRGTSRSVIDDDGLLVPFSSVKDLIGEASHILLTFLPPPDDETLLNCITNKMRADSWLGFVSTTGVYGNHDGNWVSEESPLLCKPESSAFSYIGIEQRLQEICQSKSSRCCIFRCAGLYGPSRSALHTVWKNGYESEKTTEDRAVTSENITNRIHETDVARAIVEAMVKNEAGTYNLADDEPEARSKVMEYAHNLLKASGLVEAIETESGSRQQSNTAAIRTKRRQVERKLVSNQRMKNEILPALTFPTYKEGLNSILCDGGPWSKIGS